MNQETNPTPPEPKPEVQAADVPKAFSPAPEPQLHVEEPIDEPQAAVQFGGAALEYGVHASGAEPGQGLGTGQVVRLELYLSPEQLKSLFAAIVGSQHTILTVREAATYLRVQPSVLEQMAEENQVPAVSIDGRWRFPKSGLDEWLILQSYRSGGERDVA